MEIITQLWREAARMLRQLQPVVKLPCLLKVTAMLDSLSPWYQRLAGAVQELGSR
jgi:hypothetical protein